MQKKEVGRLPYTIYKNEFKWIRDLNVIAKTIKHVKKTKPGINLHDLYGLGNGFLHMTPKP